VQALGLLLDLRLDRMGTEGTSHADV
jgi:hypothetical protein